jgi:hypothetical protein
VTTATEDEFTPRNAAELDRLQRHAGNLLASMARGSIISGQLPPTDVLKWYAHYVTEALVGTECMARQIKHDTPVEDQEYIGKQLEAAVITVAEVLRTCAVHKLFVLENDVKNILKARLLHLPPSFDYTYEGMLPR